MAMAPTSGSSTESLPGAPSHVQVLRKGDMAHLPTSWQTLGDLVGDPVAQGGGSCWLEASPGLQVPGRSGS